MRRWGWVVKRRSETYVNHDPYVYLAHTNHGRVWSDRARDARVFRDQAEAAAQALNHDARVALVDTRGYPWRSRR